MELKPTAEVRQVFRVGGSLVITLPRRWLSKQGLETGDYLVIITNGEIRILPVHSENMQAQNGNTQKDATVR